jgi:hypothetical protein
MALQTVNDRRAIGLVFHQLFQGLRPLVRQIAECL